jgi:hypothetical protein
MMVGHTNVQWIAGQEGMSVKESGGPIVIDLMDSQPGGRCANSVVAWSI